MSLKAINRRTFLETATTVTAATLTDQSKTGLAAGEHKIDKVGVQLYSVRDLMKDDFDGTIAKVAKIGYKEVEFAGYFGRTGAQVRAACDKNGLGCGLHSTCNTTNSTTEFPAVVETSQDHRPEIHRLPLDSRGGSAKVSPRHLEAGRREIQPLRRTDQESRYAVRLSQSLVRISPCRRQAPLR